jgi:outer membrane protein
MAELDRHNYIHKHVLIISMFAIIAVVLLMIFKILFVPRIGYIDSSILLQKYPAAIEANKKLTEDQDKYKKNIETLETELKNLNSTLVEKGPQMAKSEVMVLQKKIESKQEEYYKYRKAIEDKLSSKEKELMQPVFDNINNDMAEYGRKYHYAIIFGTVQGGNILYANKKVDLTNRFIKFCSKKK